MKEPLVIESIEASLESLSLRRLFRTHWKRIHQHRTLIVKLRVGSFTGEGEAYSLESEEALQVAQSLSLVGQDAWDAGPILDSIANEAVRSAFDLALHDLLGKSIDRPVHALLGLPAATRETCVSVGIDEPAKMIAAAREWIEAGYPIIKVKLTTETDLGVLEEIRKHGGPALRISGRRESGVRPRSGDRGCLTPGADRSRAFRTASPGRPYGRLCSRCREDRAADLPG